MVITALYIYLLFVYYFIADVPSVVSHRFYTTY